MTTETNSSRTKFGGWIGFLVLQIVLVSAGIAATTRRLDQMAEEKELPPARDIPLTVRPLYNDPRVVTDEQLDGVLFKLRPRLKSKDLKKINHIDHALRFWGIEAKFDDGESLSGEEMRQILLNHERFLEFMGDDTRPLLLMREEGVGVRTVEGNASASHYDHTLGGLAEVGTPLDFEIYTADGVTTVRSMLEHSLRKFSLNNVEYEWSTLAYVLYLPPTRRWLTTEGQEVTFDRLAERNMRERLNLGVCMGNHRLHALVMMLRVDDEIPILTAEGRTKILDHLRDVTARFVKHQSPEGYWLITWPDGAAPTEAEDKLQNRILATGHVLEWWSLAPEEVHPPRETVIRAGQWLSRTILELDEKQTHEYYTFLTHAGRALALWRGQFPHEFIKPGTVAKIDADAPPEPVEAE